MRSALGFMGALAMMVAGLVGVSGTEAGASSPLPLTDPTNTQGWVLQESFTDEFNGAGVDPAKWHDTWNTWSHRWRWASDASTVSEGSLTIRTSFSPSNVIDDRPNDWVEAGPSGFNDQASYVVAASPRSGQASLVHYHRWPYIVGTQRIVDVPNGTYTARAWVWSGGGQSRAEMSVAEFGAATPIVRPIAASAGYVLYEIPGINVTTGKVKLLFLSHAAGGQWLRVDDVELVRSGSTTNYVPNPGFETRDSIPYKSGILVSRNRLTHGYLEARIKGEALDYGVAPAFWLFYQERTTWTEIDAVEVQQVPDSHRIDHSTHIFRHPAGLPENPHSTVSWTAPWHPRDDYHVYAVEWDATEIKWYVDGQLKRTETANASYFDQALAVVLSAGIRAPYTSVDTATGFPTTMQVDYIRVWQRP